MKKSMIATAVLATIAFAPSSAFANYYGYERCMNGGGNWFSCLGELADVMIAAPDLEDTFGFAKHEGEDRIMESIRARSEICDVQKGDARMQCYANGLKQDLRAKVVTKPVLDSTVKAPAAAVSGSGKAAFKDLN